MKRLFLSLTMATAAMSASAQVYPDKPVKLIVPFAAGGPTDVIARLFGTQLSEQLGQPVLIDNRTGAGGNIGTAAIAKSVPDGYTIGACGASTTIAPALAKTMPYDVPKDFTALGAFGSSDLVLLVPANSPAKSVKELVALLKQKGDKANFASQSFGGSGHMATELFKVETQTTPTHVPFRGSAPALVELIAGRVDLMFDNVTTSLPFITSGTLLALAVTSAQRHPRMPNVPTFKEGGVDLVMGSWIGMCGPAGLPKPVLDRLAGAIAKVAESRKFQEKLVEAGQTPYPLGAVAMQEKLGADVARWKQVVQIGKIPVE